MQLSKIHLMNPHNHTQPQHIIIDSLSLYTSATTFIIIFNNNCNKEREKKSGNNIQSQNDCNPKIFFFFKEKAECNSSFFPDFMLHSLLSLSPKILKIKQHTQTHTQTHKYITIITIFTQQRHLDELWIITRNLNKYE